MANLDDVAKAYPYDSIPDISDADFAKEVKDIVDAIAKRKGITTDGASQEVAQDLGVSKPSIDRWSEGKRMPPQVTRKAIHKDIQDRIRKKYDFQL